ncbi:hypothetical protein ACFFHM_07780 [Halalkalibacter kiskunsagensis]|uniref:Uncharacterized protein n=1 Tax=Halalkalibacter kiskunsagensis TaxID=1548599 RepID=A0ABV6KAT2_9BACI
MKLNIGSLCESCGKYHDELPMSYRSPAPEYYYDVPSEARSN